MRVHIPRMVCLAAALLCIVACAAQEVQPPPEPPKSELQYQDTFSGPIVELKADRITVSRSVLGKPAERRSFWIKADTRIEGRLKVKVKVTVGFVSSDDGYVARLIVVRPPKK